MKEVKIVACCDIANDVVVKGVKFDNHEIIGNVVELAKKYSDNGASEIVYYDILASCENRDVNWKLLQEVAKVINKPLCVAGNINSLDKVQKALDCGCSKVSLNSPAIQNPDLINQIADKFGSDKVVVGIDVRSGFIFKNAGDPSKMKNANINFVDWAKEVENRGAGEIVLNSIDTDGMKQGYDIESLKLICNAVKIPVIASGGAGKIEDFVEVFQKTGVSGALGASVFHKNLVDIKELKEKLQENGVLVC